MPLFSTKTLKFRYLVNTNFDKIYPYTMTTEEIVQFNRTKIYEKLEYVPMPENYRSKLPWVVQNQIAATNGMHYIDRIGKLKNYPVYELPVKAVSGDKLMLDIGSGWGRWLISGSNKGYIPVAADIRLEFCEAQQNTLKAFNRKGYSVVADLENLPFQPSTFDLVWSFSVIQHTHQLRLINCLKVINSILKEDGFTYLEFPNKNGIRNKKGPAVTQEKFKNNYNSWCVRYYTVEEYRNIFDQFLNGFDFYNHSFLGIGVLKEDLKYVSLKNKILCSASLMLSSLTHVMPGLKNHADSIYIKAFKKGTTPQNTNLNTFLDAHKTAPFDNLHIVPLLKCPKTGKSLQVNETRDKIISREAGLYYPIINDIPILISGEASTL